MTSRATKGSAAALLAVLALLVAGLVSPATAATSTGTIKGTVTVDGTPVGTAKVQLYPLVLDRSNGEYEVSKRFKTDNTDSKGRYSFTKVPSSTTRYVVLVKDRTGRTVKDFRYVTLKKGKAVTRNVALKRAASLSGRVGTVDGRSSAGLTVGVDLGSYNDLGQSYEQLYPVTSTTVREDGTFFISGLPARLYDSVVLADGPYAQQCYDLVASTLADCAPADPVAFQRQRITLAPGEVRVLPTVTATKFAPAPTTLSGRVTDSSGKALKGIGVTITSAGAETMATTRSSGRFSVKESLPAGSYTVRYDDPARKLASQFFGGGPDKVVRQPVVLTPGQPVGGLDARLKSDTSRKVATKTGKGTAKVAVKITRKVNGSLPSGTLTVAFESSSATVKVVKGKATVTLSGLPKGALTLKATYSGTSTTAGFTRPVKVTVK